MRIRTLSSRGTPWRSSLWIASAFCLAMTLAPKTASASMLLKSVPNNLGIVGFWNFNAGTGTSVADSSGSGNTGTWAGTGSHWTGGKFSNGGSFNGTDDYVSVLDAASLKFGTGNFTISFWIKTTISSSYASVIDKGFSNAGIYYIVVQGSDGSLDFRVVDTNNAGILDTTRGSGFNDGAWHHGLMTVNRANNILKIYKDGVQAGTDVDISSVLANVSPTDQLRIGNTITGSYHFPGSIDEVRIYNRALSAGEVRTLYNSTGVGKVSGITANGLVGYWPFSEGGGTATADKSGNGRAGTLTNFALATTTSNWVTGKFGNAINFDGVDDYVDMGNILDAPATFTISAWFKSTDANQNNRGIAGRWGDTGYMLWLSGGKLNMPINGGPHLAGTTEIRTGAWFFLTGTFDGATARVYVNGALEGSQAESAPTASSVNWVIGRYSTGGVNVAGVIDDVRIYNRALSANEVKAIYNQTRDMPVYAKVNVTRNNPASNLQNGLVGWWPFDGKYLTTTTATDLGSGHNNGTLTGANGKPTPTIGKLGSALRFDGVDDYVDVPTISIPSDVSASVWMKVPSYSPDMELVMKNTVNTQWDLFIWNALITWRGGSTTQITCTHPSTNAWHHIVGTQAGTTATLYIDGVQCSTGAVTAIGNSAGTINVGRYNSGEYLNGSIDDVRVYNRALSADEVGQLYRMGK